ncbi:hypothetical protein PAXRUDRAFT_78335, partial [Paxillus rubicundulus Ve08.2h10]
VFITPCHSVRRHWNSQMSQVVCSYNNTPIFRCKAFDTICQQPLTIGERIAVITKPIKRQGKANERGGLLNMVELAIGMQMMIT